MSETRARGAVPDELRRLAEEECENGMEAIGETCSAAAADPDNIGDPDYPLQHWCGPCIAKHLLAKDSHAPTVHAAAADSSGLGGQREARPPLAPPASAIEWFDEPVRSSEEEDCGAYIGEEATARIGNAQLNAVAVDGASYVQLFVGLPKDIELPAAKALAEGVYAAAHAAGLLGAGTGGAR